MAWLVLAVLIVVTILAEIFMPWVMVPFVPGFLDDQEKFDLTVLLTRILFPYLACMSLMAAYGGDPQFARTATSPRRSRR